MKAAVVVLLLTSPAAAGTARGSIRSRWQAEWIERWTRTDAERGHRADC